MLAFEISFKCKRLAIPKLRDKKLSISMNTKMVVNLLIILKWVLQGGEIIKLMGSGINRMYKITKTILAIYE